MNYTAAILTISDKGYCGQRTDTSGPALWAILEEHGLNVIYQTILPDERDMIRSELLHCADERGANLILTTGGTGFSPRDVTPEATLDVIDRLTPGIPEAMRAESMKYTPRGCLSRGTAGIRGGSLIVNLPGSEKAARENILAVIQPILHGLDMLASSGSADCAETAPAPQAAPSLDTWLREAKLDPASAECGMYLCHRGVVRRSAKAAVRQGAQQTKDVSAMLFSYDADKLADAIAHAQKMPGIRFARVWLNQGRLRVGDDIMQVLVGGDIRPHVTDALQALIDAIKTDCVSETEIFEP